MIRLIQYLFIARRTLLEHKLRSFLTILGIIFGVAAVIAMTAIGEGAKEEALKQIEQMGIQNIFLHDRSEHRRSALEKGKYITSGLSEQDVNIILQSIPSIQKSSAIKEKELFVQTTLYQSKTIIKGVEPSYFPILNGEISLGRLLHEIDLLRNHKVCVLGSEIAQKIFGASPLGQVIKINGSEFEVVGILKDRPGMNLDLFIPLTHPVLNEKTVPFEPELTTVIFHLTDIPLIPLTAEMIEKTILRRHLDIPDFEMVVPEALFRQQERTRDIFNSIMILITGISLLVGGIGIMNIMLASVMERTKEIGIRRGMGATKKDIQMQFLGEAIVLTAAGGVIGILLGLALTQGIEIFTGWKTKIPISSIFISFSFSVIIGVIFGYYPAKNASQMNPIDALRYE